MLSKNHLDTVACRVFWICIDSFLHWLVCKALKHSFLQIITTYDGLWSRFQILYYQRAPFVANNCWCNTTFSTSLYDIKRLQSILGIISVSWDLDGYCFGIVWHRVWNTASYRHGMRCGKVSSPSSLSTEQVQVWSYDFDNRNNQKSRCFQKFSYHP